MSCSCFKEALRLCKSVSGFGDKGLALELDVDLGQWSRIWSGTAHFPENKIEPFMILCGNLIPLRWLALKFGFELRPLKSSLEIDLEKAIAEKVELQKKLTYFEELWQKGRP